MGPVGPKYDLGRARYSPRDPRNAVPTRIGLADLATPTVDRDRPAFGRK